MSRSAAARTPLCRVVVDEIRSYCRSMADPERARKYARYFTEGYDAYGVDHRHPSWEANRREWGERLRAAGPEVFLDAGDLLVRTGKYEEASMAILIAIDSRHLYTKEAFRRIGGWFNEGIRNWGHTDVLCGDVLSRFLLDNIVGLPDLEPWRDSSFKYQRRAVPVMLIKLLDHPIDLAAVLYFLRPLMVDSERVVHQGMGWFLREVWKRNPRLAEGYLLEYRDTAPRLIVQYATEKMPASARGRFRRQK